LTKRQKLIAKVAIGLTAAGAVALTTATLGLGGLLFGTAGAAASRGYRAYKLQQAEIYGDTDAPDDAKIEHANADGSIRSTEDILNETKQKDATNIDQRIEKGDKTKKKAVYMALGAVAVGGAMTAIEAGMDVGVWGGDHAGAINHPSTGGNPESPQTPQPENPTVVPPEHPAPSEPTREFVPTAPGDMGSIDLPVSPEAHSIFNGQGWYSKFGQLGIVNAHDQSALLHDDILMSKLSNMGLAYPDSSATIGGWGMNMTGNGQFPQPAIDLIQQRAAQLNYTLVR